MRRRHCSQTTAKTVTRPNSAGTPQMPMNRQKLSRPISPTRMFCGLPMSVAADPALVEAASAIANGRGSQPRARAPTINSGAIVTIRMSLASTAESAPPIATVSASSTVVPCSVLVKVRAQRSMNPDSANCAEMIIIANNSARVGRSTLLPKSSRFICPVSNSAMTASSAIPVRSTCSQAMRPAAMPK
jgi:hypothetical protein